MYVIFRKLGKIPTDIQTLLTENATHKVTGLIDFVDEDADSIFDAVVMYRFNPKVYSEIATDELRKQCATYGSLKRLNLEIPIVQVSRKKLS